MHRITVLAVSAGLAVASAATAETRHLLDIPSGSGTDISWSSAAGVDSMPFEIASEHMNFRFGGFATEGVVRAWDYENDENAKGKVFFEAAEGVEFTSFAFDLSGFKEYDSVARLKIKLNGETWKDKTWSFDGNSTLIQKAWVLGEGITSIEIVLQNLEGGAFHGLDNMNIGTVPAPGVLALLGIAGVAGNRRRRG